MFLFATLLQNKIRNMKTLYHAAQSRGHAYHGWLNTYHSFSFANYYNPDRINFGVLRVLNDDTIAEGMGFGRHPHRDMEIISIPLDGALEHRDSMGNEGVIRRGEIQVMSAGTGVEHSEYNHNKTEEVKFLQIWLFPRELNLTPRYDQKTIDIKASENNFLNILSPSKEDDTVWINQDAWFYWSNLKEGVSKKYILNKEGNGVYIFVLKGQLRIADHILTDRDALGVWDTENFDIVAHEDTEVLIMEMSMELPTYLKN